jgi:hypothetical protein
MKTVETVEERLQGFISRVQAEQASHYAKNLPNSVVPTITAKAGSKNYKIITTGPGTRSVYCFVDKATGAILKAASWAQPAKGIRGSIFDTNYSWGKGVGLYGAAYKR